MENLQKTMENHHAINGKLHYFYGDFPWRTVTNYQRVTHKTIGFMLIANVLNTTWKCS